MLSWRWHAYRNRRFNGHRLSPIEAEILSLFVMRHGWARSEIEEIIWGDAEDGGPLDMRNNLDIHFGRINRKIAPWRIRRLRRGYAILELDEVLDLGNYVVAEGSEQSDERADGISTILAAGCEAHRVVEACALEVQADA